MKSLLKLAMALALLTPILKAQDTRLDDCLRSGKLQEGLAAFAKPANDGERFSLAVLQTLQGFQQFADGTSRLGIKPSLGRNLPFFRFLPTQPAGQAAEVATPEKVRALFTNLRESLKKANATLAKVGDGDFKVQVNLSRAHLSTKDGSPAMPLTESLSRILGIGAANEQDIVVNFDSADAAWLKGYTHLLTGLLEIFTSYDWGPVWNQMSYLLFTSPNPMPPMAKYAVSAQGQGGPSEWADLIAAVHDLRLEVKDADGLKRALVEFRSMIACSRLCWTRIQAETDDDLEWLPSARQKGPRGATITQAQIDGWGTVLGELDGIFSGKKLLPHWRIINGMGINVARLVQNPPKLDLVLMVQGSAFVPYIEGGDVSNSTRWQQLTAPFGPGGFMSFALWSN